MHCATDSEAVNQVSVKSATETCSWCVKIVFMITMLFKK